MRITNTVIPAIAIIALCSAAMPAAADQQRDRDNRGRDRATVRSAPRENAPAQQSRARDAQPQQNASRGDQSRRREPVTATPRSNDTRRSEPITATPRGNDARRSEPFVAPPRSNDARRNDSGGVSPRGYDSRRGNSGFASPRPYAQPRDTVRDYVGSRPGWRGGPSRPVFSFRPYYGRVPYYRYSFRPHLHLGFGLWIGYPIYFPDESYLYARSSTYSEFGGLSFEVNPDDAYVYVDGYYVGAAGDFNPDQRPLSLRVGTHRIEVEAPGYRTVVFEVNVLPGQLIPFRGQLEYVGG